jgi:hypothetical protein
MSSTLRYTLIALTGTLLAAAGTQVAAQQATGTFRRTLDVSVPLQLDVATGAGSVTIRGGASGRADVVGDIRVGRGFPGGTAAAEELVRRLEAEPPIELAGGSLRIGHLDREEYRRHVSISYTIEVPADTTVRSRTGSGSQELVGIAGPSKVDTGSGAIALTDIRGPVEASTGSGSIRADGIAGAFNGHTGSGSVRLVQTAGSEAVVSTGSGSAELRGVNGVVRVRTGSGSVTVDGAQGGAWDLQTGSGSIRVYLPQDAAFELDARTGSGAVYAGHPVTVQGAVEKGNLRGVVRGGGPVLRARTGSGGIRIE